METSNLVTKNPITTAEKASKKRFFIPICALMLFIYTATLSGNVFYDLYAASLGDYGSFLLTDVVDYFVYLAFFVVILFRKRGIPVALMSFATIVLKLVCIVCSNNKKLVHLNNNLIVYLKWTILVEILILICILMLALNNVDFIMDRLRDNEKLAKTIKALPNILLIVIFALGVLHGYLYGYRYGLIRALLRMTLSASLMLTGLWVKKGIFEIPINITVKEKTAREVNKVKSVSAVGAYRTSIVAHILLTIFTFGIWYMIWICKVTKFTNLANGEQYRNPVTKLLLCLFVPFYKIYWTYKSAERIDIIAKDEGVFSDIAGTCLALALFAGFIPSIIMQEKINRIAEA